MMKSRKGAKTQRIIFKSYLHSATLQLIFLVVLVR